MPLKWRIADGSGGYITDLEVITAVGYQEVSCGDLTAIGPAFSAQPSGGSALRYDITEDQYVFNWKTEKSMAGGCYSAYVELYGTDVHEAYFQFR